MHNLLNTDVLNVECTLATSRHAARPGAQTDTTELINNRRIIQVEVRRADVTRLRNNKLQDFDLLILYIQ